MSKVKPDQNLLNHLQKNAKQVAPLAVNFILDKSGSMGSMTSSVIDGFNEYVSSLKKKKNILFSLTLFDSDEVEKRYVAEPLKNVLPLDESNYVPGSMTPLYDAVCETVKEASKTLGKNYPKYSSVVVIMTDGQENSSSKYTAQDFIKLKQSLEKKGNWTFVFMGANQDAWVTAQNLGFTMGNTVTWNATAKGADEAFRGLGKATELYMASIGSDSKAMSTQSYFNQTVKDKIENTK